MKGKELAKILSKDYAEHEIVIQEYTGCNHTIFSATELIPAEKGQTLKNWDSSGDGNFNPKTGAAKKKVLLIK
jgi:hypothetical protein